MTVAKYYRTPNQRQRSGWRAIAHLLREAALLFLASIVVFWGSSLVDARAQNTNATIRGQVVDPSGALVRGAQVVIVNTETGVTAFTGPTDSAGVFVAAQVLPGTYQLTVTAPGLKKGVLNDLIATVAQTTSVNVKLELGPVTETVVATTRGPELDTTTSGISTIISPEEVQNLPLEGRTTENLLMLIPGASYGGPADQPNTNQLSVNGSRTLNTEILLDGVSMIDAATGYSVTLPSPDAIDSIRVLTTNAPAEYGRTSGFVLSVSSRAGTNTYHGNLYFLLRNEALDANQYFHKDVINAATGSVTPRNRDRFFQEGGTLGGPLRIPHVYDGRDRTFFFINYDHTNIPASQLVTDTVPTAQQRTGNLSNALATTDANGNPRTPEPIYQPTGKTSAAFTNAQVGPIDPAAAQILSLLPLPNTVGTYDPVNNRYTGNWTQLQNLSGENLRLLARLDEVLTPRDRLAFHTYRLTASSPLGMDYGSQLFNTEWACNCTNSWQAETDYTHVWTPNIVSDLNMGFLRNVSVRTPPGVVGNVSQTVGIASLPLNQFPKITDPGISQLGGTADTILNNTTNTFTPFGSVTEVAGPHTLTFGASLRRNEFNTYNPAGYPEGVITFDGSTTNHGASGNANTGLADFLLGKIKTAQYEQPESPGGRRNYNWAVYAKDDWRISSRLTLNLGLRYEYESPMVITSNQYSRISPETGQLLIANMNGVSRSLNISTPKADLSPRLGFAYSINDKTVIRGGYGTFYGTIFQNLGGQVAFPGFDYTVNYYNQGTAIAQPFSLSQGIPLAPPPNLQNPQAAFMAATQTSPFTTGASFDNLSHISLVEQWNIGFQRLLPLGLTLEVNYIGNHALHLPYQLQVNEVPLSQVAAVGLQNNTTSLESTLQYPTISSFYVYDDIGNSGYNGLQTTVRRQFDRKLAILSSYTYSKTIDDGSTLFSYSSPNGQSDSQYPVAGPNFLQDTAVGSIDDRQVLNIAMVYTTPGPWWLRGWHISPVFVGRTGLPVNISQTNNIPGSAQRPNGNQKLLPLAKPYLNGSALQYFATPENNASFPLTPAGPVYNTINGVRTLIVATGFGDVPRNSMRAPGEVDLDAAVSKDFLIHKILRFQFRVDAFNVLNHTNLGAPATALTVTEVGTTATFATSSAFGKITTTLPNRVLQASARLFF